MCIRDSYEGGELVIENDKTIKLSKGKAVLYPGNLLHRVNEVKSGTRNVFIGWLQTQ